MSPDVDGGPAPAGVPDVSPPSDASTIVTLEDLHAQTIANAEASLAGLGTGTTTAVAAGGGLDGESPSSRSARSARPTRPARPGRTKRPDDPAASESTLSTASAAAPDPLGLLDSDLTDLAARLDRLGAPSSAVSVTDPLSAPVATSPAATSPGDSPA